MIIIGILVWALIISIELVFLVIGLPIVAIKLWLWRKGYLKHEALNKGLYRWGEVRPVTWWEAAVRNPVAGMKQFFTQPCDAQHPNPDDLVRNGEPWAKSFMESGIYWEYWYMRRCRDGEYFEFRIGWRFGDTEENFSPTLQVRKGP